ncbi:MAG: hypothetical protein Q9164_003040 [Protoblastenia rupestris]
MTDTTIIHDASASLGDLARLPREVRDAIYRYLVCGTYTVDWPKFLEGSVISSSFTKDKKDTGILRVSKKVNTETEQLMYTDSLFVFTFLYTSFADVVQFEEPHVDGDSNRMMNVHFEVDVRGAASHVTKDFDASDTQIASEATLRKFCGGGVNRNKFSLTIKNCVPKNRTAWSTKMLTTPFCRGLRELVSFKTVHILVSSRPRNQYNTSKTEGLRVFDKETLTLNTWNHHVFNECQSLLNGLRAELEPTLGPARMVDSSAGTNCYYKRDLTFDPHDHLASMTNND